MSEVNKYYNISPVENECKHYHYTIYYSSFNQNTI